MSTMTVGFAGTTTVLDREAELTFGRDADLEIDSNPFLHRRLGHFSWRRGTWWIANIGSAIPLEVCDLNSSSRVTVSPGTSSPIAFERSIMRFQAGRAVYELELETALVGSSTSLDQEWASGDLAGVPTVTASGVALNREQRLLLVTLAEKRLRDWGLGRSELPTNREAADRLGWTITKFNRKLDNLCIKFDKLGIAGLKGDLGALAGNRREKLVEHVLIVGLISTDDLGLFDGDGE